MALRDEHIHTARKTMWLRLIAILVLACGVVVIFKVTPARNLLAFSRMQELVSSAGSLAPLIYVGIYALLSIFLFSSTVLNILAGTIFGFPMAFVWAWIGTMLGATTSYKVGRFAGRPFVERHFGRLGKWGDLMKSDGLLLTFAFRFLVPFPFLNYLASTTPIRFRDYVCGTAIAQIPVTFFSVYIGDILRELWRTGDLNVLLDGRVAIAVVPLVLGIALALWLRQTIAKRREVRAP